MISLPYQNPQALDFNRERPYKQACFTLCNFVTFNFLILILLQILLPEQGTPGDRKKHGPVHKVMLAMDPPWRG